MKINFIIDKTGNTIYFILVIWLKSFADSECPRIDFTERNLVMHEVKFSNIQLSEISSYFFGKSHAPKQGEGGMKVASRGSRALLNNREMGWKLRVASPLIEGR